MHALPKLGVGLAYQAPLNPLFDSASPPIDYVEVVPDIFWTDRGPAVEPRYLEDAKGLGTVSSLARRWPLVAHGIGLSIGSADGFETDHLGQVERWWQRHRFPWHSDHLAFHLAEHQGVRANAGITLPLARDRESIDLLVPRIREVMRRVPAPFLLENNVYYFDIPEAEMDEATFLDTLCRESGCGLLLDLHNLHTNARNHGFDPFDVLRHLDMRHVGEIHVAGGMELDGFYLDAHSDVIPEAVWHLLEWTLPRCRNIGGVTFEIFGSWVESVGLDAIQADLERLQALWSRCQGEATAHPAQREVGT
ncbi:DUF692 domain-containing protein [Marilutibacter spongiae]|uniref:DUF692 domain-containing protein n=1 Tax=Marilutibacter spongiae TaxID=2025720 RepID=A0A7W3TLW8_9GAMM|nr:DUF692 family multinuclear iron-containing protein [Lysobacter spongiae]MBB1060738.1 DUF692 domain-containing protein [Lysobacter spongiae]